jgi:small subunit ribosomal protein S18
MNKIEKNKDNIYKTTFDYKNIDILKKFLSLEGKIIARRKSGLNSKQHRYVSKSIKRARAINLLPFINNKS